MAENNNVSAELVDNVKKVVAPETANAAVRKGGSHGATLDLLTCRQNAGFFGTLSGRCNAVFRNLVSPPPPKI